jgi:hypothetical protein
LRLTDRRKPVGLILSHSPALVANDHVHGT